jgi:hypothetical protein
MLEQLVPHIDRFTAVNKMNVVIRRHDESDVPCTRWHLDNVIAFYPLNFRKWRVRWFYTAIDRSDPIGAVNEKYLDQRHSWYSTKKKKAENKE